MHYEKASERWSPIQSVEKILISVMSMLAEPNDESPANVEAAKMWRERKGEFEERVRRGREEGLGIVSEGMFIANIEPGKSKALGHGCICVDPNYGVARSNVMVLAQDTATKIKRLV